MVHLLCVHYQRLGVKKHKVAHQHCDWAWNVGQFDFGGGLEDLRKPLGGLFRGDRWLCVPIVAQ